jgi:hypothetical protein
MLHVAEVPVMRQRRTGFWEGTITIDLDA